MVDKRRSKTSLFKHSNVMTMNYGNHRSEIVIVFDLYEGHWGVIFE